MLTNSYYLIIDQGTSSSKIFLFDSGGQNVYTRRAKHGLERPAEYHVESDAREIYLAINDLLIDAVQFVVREGGLIKAAGLAVQRSTFLFWDKNSLQPLSKAISWQDTRARAIVPQYTAHSETIQGLTGTPLSAHFGAPKYLHLELTDANLSKAVSEGSVWFGPLSSYLTSLLTGRVVVDQSIAGRSLLMGLERVEWSQHLIDLFGVNPDCLPPLSPVYSNYGDINIGTHPPIPLKVVIGDQQAALIGQGGIKDGSLAMNLGTSGSIQFNSGRQAGQINGLVSSVLFSSENICKYMLEGTINSCNSLFYHLEEKLGIPHSEMVWHDRCERTSTKGVYLSGFLGLAAPYWLDKFETRLHNLEDANQNEIIRAAMESIGFLVHDIFQVIKTHFTIDTDLITVSGGGARPPLLQFIADLLQIPVGHSQMKDRTALGVYNLLWYEGLPVSTETGCDLIFKPAMNSGLRQSKLRAWQELLSGLGIEPVGSG